LADAVTPLAGTRWRHTCPLRIVIRERKPVTTMAWGNERIGFMGVTRWRATLAHGGILVALCAGVLALWTAVALVAALLAHPVPTMTTLEREGARGVAKVVRDGSAVVVRHVRERVNEGDRR
jgi:hypothetical protein